MSDTPSTPDIGLSVGLAQRTVSRRSSVVSTSSSFFDRSFFSTPETRIVDHGRRTTLAYATLTLNLYNNISLDLRSSVDACRRIVVQAVASKTRAAQLVPVLARVHADADDAIATARAVSAIRSFDSISDLLCRALQHPQNKQDKAADEYQDCLPCKLVGAGAMSGLAAYALHARSELDPVRFARRRQGLAGVSAAFVALAVFRLLQ
ncbi:hypothetical protein BX667DRAFT_515244 [Coemansia mojavensis]|nr:hypothetical protein BX667DRAFT_515244 [Coemansia mojavensis]